MDDDSRSKATNEARRHSRRIPNRTADTGSATNRPETWGPPHRGNATRTADVRPHAQTRERSNYAGPHIALSFYPPRNVSVDPVRRIRHMDSTVLAPHVRLRPMRWVQELSVHAPESSRTSARFARPLAALFMGKK